MKWGLHFCVVRKHEMNKNRRPTRREEGRRCSASRQISRYIALAVMIKSETKTRDQYPQPAIARKETSKAKPASFLPSILKCVHRVNGARTAPNRFNSKTPRGDIDLLIGHTLRSHTKSHHLGREKWAKKFRWPIVIVIFTYRCLRPSIKVSNIDTIRRSSSPLVLSRFGAIESISSKHSHPTMQIHSVPKKRRRTCVRTIQCSFWYETSNSRQHLKLEANWHR